MNLDGSKMLKNQTSQMVPASMLQIEINKNRNKEIRRG